MSSSKIPVQTPKVAKKWKKYLHPEAPQKHLFPISAVTNN